MHQAQAHHGGKGLDLAGHARCDDPAVVHRHQPQAGHGELPGHDDDQRPVGEAAHGAEAGHGGEHQHLVRQRVHELAEVGHQIVLPGDVAVQKIGKAGHHEHRQGGVIVAGKVQVPQHQVHGYEDNAQQGQFVG